MSLPAELKSRNSKKGFLVDPRGEYSRSEPVEAPRAQIPLERLNALTRKAGIQAEETANIDLVLFYFCQAHIAVGGKMHLQIGLEVESEHMAL